ncbi:MAG: hypothetical protein L3K15_09295 [Thermoplasmata archaeon]|nr:hypothetical protein [Thermoplasmata archaeon]
MSETVPAPEHLTPHDLVTYFRCPHEMELQHAEHRHHVTGAPFAPITPAHVAALRHSPLLGPPMGSVTVVDGRLDLDDGDTLVYLDDEEGLPILFPPERVRLDPRFTTRPRNLIDAALGFAGRPDYVIERRDGALVPVEYKSTHLFVGFHEVHGRAFDVLQAIAECRLVEAAFGRRPPMGFVLYGDAAGGGLHEGFVQVRYGEAESHWLAYALATIRADAVRAPVPSDRTCPHCAPNRLGLCAYAATKFDSSALHPPPPSSGLAAQ